MQKKKKLLGIASQTGALTAAFIGMLACHSSRPATGVTGNSNSATGASTPSGAVQLFFDAIHAGDLQAMSVAWGTKDGPTRDHIPPEELEKREVVLQCYFSHDSYRILGPAQDQQGGKSFKVEITRGQRARTTTVSTVQGPSERWYVQNLDIASVRDLCGSSTNRQ